MLHRELLLSDVCTLLTRLSFSYLVYKTDGFHLQYFFNTFPTFPV